MDSNKIAEIADVMEGRGLTRVRVEEPDGSAFELERAVREAAPAVVMPQVVAAPLAVPAAGTAAAEADVAASAAPEPAEAEPAGVEVTSPMVGVYYASPAPDAEPFVRVGSKVRKGETLCIIEAMKVMNEVAATADGEILSIEAADGDLVEYGSCLMRIG